MSTRFEQENLASALVGKTRRAVLALLYAHPDESFFLRQVARATGSGQGSVQRELRRLLEAGIIERSGHGRQVYYQANRQCPVFAELQGLMTKTVGLADVLRSALSPVAGKVDVAFVYGSHASGKATGSSDVDLLVVGDVDEMALHKAVGRAEGQLGRSVNYTLLSRHEFARRRKAKGGFLARVLGGPKVPILGSPDEV
jgi:DNA-binding transcriptional ArsR family regulator